MEYFILILFIIAAIFGAVNLTGLITFHHAPRLPMILHGLIVSVGLLLLISYSAAYGVSFIPIYLFLAAACGGLVMVYLDLAGKRFPRWIGFIHGAIALSGIFSFVYFVWFK